MNRKISRRNFLGEASCKAVGTTAFLSSILNLGMINTLSARPHIITNTNDYKAMVCILLAGGADTHNVLIPTEQSEYNDYKATRGDLALNFNDPDGAPDEAIALDYSTNGKTYAIHSGMTAVRDLFNDGNLAFLANIGTLIEPIANESEYFSGAKKLPLGLYSHSDQIMHWQTSVPQSRSAVGVGGRMADILKDMNTIPEVSMNISLAGKNRFQTGNNVIEYAISRNSNVDNIGFDGFNNVNGETGFLNDLKNNTVKSLAEESYQNIFESTIGSLTNQTSESIEIMQAAFANIVPLSTTFSDNNLSEDLKKIAETISVRSHLGANRQIFFVTVGGWDHHDNVKGNMDVMMPMVSNAMGEFYAAMEELNMENDVVTFTISDFARTLTSNGNGSDHAWGGNQMIMGGMLNGKQIYGDYPSLAINNNDLNISDRGRIIPTTSVDEFYAELALWFGVSPNDLNYVLPNLCNFYASSNCTVPPDANYSPLGMFS